MSTTFKKLLIEKISTTDIENKILVYITKLEGHLEIFIDEKHNIEELLENIEKYDLQIQEYISALEAIVNYTKKTKDLTKAIIGIVNNMSEGKLLSEITKVDKADNTIMDYLKIYNESLDNLNTQFEKLDNFDVIGTTDEIKKAYNVILIEIWKILNNLQSKTIPFKEKLETIFNTKGKPRGRGYKDEDENYSEEIDDDEEEE